ncbi:MAG: glycosyltransferase, partial [Candidatus Taylorbacteria bacterium]|nr:glycosyltransferase [Candidatus Taylorbacteria bacterium]
KIEKLRSIQRFVVKNSDVVIAPSLGFAKFVERWSEEGNTVQAIYNGIDLTKIEKMTVGISVRPKTLISAGRLIYNKGFDILIKAMSKLPDWSLEIAGDGPEQAKLEELIKSEKLVDRVRLLGRLDKDELVKRVASSEIFVLNTYYETFSFQLIEAMCSGTPVIVTRVGSLKEIITDGVNGVLFTPNEEGELLAAIKRVHSDPTFRNNLINEGKKRARNFSIDSTVEAVKKIVVSLMESPVPVTFSRRAKIAKIIRYLFSGGLAALTDIVLIYLFTDFFGMWYLLSSVLAFLVAFVVSFVLQKFFTFQDHGIDSVHSQVFVYLLVTGTNLIINTALIYVF